MAWLAAAESTLVMDVPDILSLASDLSKGLVLVPGNVVSPEKIDPGKSEVSFSILPVSGGVLVLETGNPCFERLSAGVKIGLGVAGTLDFAGRYFRSNGFPEVWPQTTVV